MNQLVGLSGLEPLTSRLSGVRSNQLSYRPILFESLTDLSKPNNVGYCTKYSAKVST